MSWSGNQIPLAPTFLTPKGRYGLLSKAAMDYDRLNLNLDFISNEIWDAFGVCRGAKFLNDTVFKEIKIGSPVLNEAEKQYCYDSNGWNKPYQPLTTTLENILVRDWEPDKTHVFLHSAGYDSRLISHVLSKLRDKMGNGWIGNLVFLCWEPEGEVFKEIMQFEGWSPKYYHVYKERCQIDFRAELIEFSQVWKWANSYYLPWYAAGPAIEELRKLNRIPQKDEICLLSAMWGNEVPMRNNYLRKQPSILVGETFPNFQVDSLFNEFYYRHEMSTTNSTLLSYGPFKLPYSDIDVAPYVTNNEEECRRISPEFHGLTFREDNHPYFFYLKDNFIWFKTDKRLSETTRKLAASNFYNSWYAKTRGFPEIDLAPAFDVQPSWWRDYVLAATCEHLINQGVKIKIE